MKKLVLFILLAITVSCSKNEPITDNSTTVVKNGVFICSEGNFMSGNSILSIYNPDSKLVQNDIYSKANNVPLGDVCQSMSIIDGKGFIVVNNSAKVVVIDLDSYKQIGLIDNLNSPRYIEKINDDKIYITDLYSNAITIANPKTYQVTGEIPIGKGTEQMVKHGDYLFTCSWSFSNQVYRIDTRTDKLIDSIAITKQPNSITIDKNNKIWVLSDGGYPGSPYGQVNAALTKIDAASFEIEKVFEFQDINLSPSELTIDGEKGKLYFICGGFGSGEGANNGLFTMSVDATSLPSDPIVPENGRLFYGLAISPKTGDIYLSDAIDYQQKGIILRYNNKGEKIDEFKAGMTPGAFCFR